MYSLYKMTPLQWNAVLVLCDDKIIRAHTQHEHKVYIWFTIPISCLCKYFVSKLEVRSLCDITLAAYQCVPPSYVLHNTPPEKLGVEQLNPIQVTEKKRQKNMNYIDSLTCILLFESTSYAQTGSFLNYHMTYCTPENTLSKSSYVLQTSWRLIGLGCKSFLSQTCAVLFHLVSSINISKTILHVKSFRVSMSPIRTARTTTWPYMPTWNKIKIIIN